MITSTARSARASIVLCVSLLLGSAGAEEVDRSPAKALTLSEALALGKKNNRDLLAARERLKGAHADVERAIAALLPRLTVQGRFTVNHPEVLLDTSQLSPVDPRVQAFSGVLQGATLSDLARQSMLQPGPGLQAVAQYCQTTNTADPNRAAVDELCQVALGQKPAQMLTAGSIGETLAKTGGSGTFAIVPRTQIDGTIALTMPLIAPPAYAALQGAKRAYAAQEKGLAVTEAQLLQSVASAFYAAAGSDELVLARRHAIEVSQQTLQNARARLEAGVVNRVEVTRAELALIQAQQRLLEAEDGRGAAYRVLATLILYRDPFKVVPPKDPEIEGRSDGELVAEALGQRPELAQLELSVRAAESQATAAGLRWLPTLGLFGNMRLTNATGFAGRADSYAAGLQLDWLLFDGFERDAARHVASAQARESRLRLRQLKDSIADEVQNARRQALTRREGLKTSQRSVQLAKETLDLVRIQHDAGTATQLDLLTAQDQLVLAEVAVAQARFDLSLSDIGLRRLVGRGLE